MLKIIKVASSEVLNTTKIDYCNDDHLHNYLFTLFNDDAFTHSNLTKFRLINKIGQIASIELKKGFIIGLELLGVNISRAIEIDTSREVKQIEEVPINSFELDGTNSKCSIDLFTVDQEIDFDICTSKNFNKVEIIFGEIHYASKLGDALIYYNYKNQLSGMKLLNVLNKN